MGGYLSAGGLCAHQRVEDRQTFHNITAGRIKANFEGIVAVGNQGHKGFGIKAIPFVSHYSIDE